jgi:3-dehydroquinate dehydratase/shikimate dehydrogenase
MICISIAQDSRRFALVDMFNAAPQCDLLEVRLDRFGKSPDIGELIAAKPKPVILSVRRPQDGGEWDGSEEERLTILRQCIISKADYVEIELDAADHIRPFPGCKRVISYYNLEETPEDLPDIYAECQKKKPDIIKLVTRADTPEEAWPLVQILSKPAMPTVVVGLGKPGVMLSILGRKMEAPWTYAALERGLEAYPDQATINDLATVYRYKSIGRQTKLVGVTGFSPHARATVALVNAAFAHLKQNTRCLPMEVGSVRLFRKVLEAVKMSSALIETEHREAVAEVASHLERTAQLTRAVDLIAHTTDGWHGYYLYDKAIVAVLKAVVGAKNQRLEGRTVLLAGTDVLTAALAHRLAKNGAILIIAGRDRDRSHTLAQALKCRHAPYEAIYSTLHDIVVVAEGKLHSGYLKGSMSVVDVTADLGGSPFLREARIRECGVVEPRQVLIEHVMQHVRLLTGQEVPREPLQAVLDEVAPVEEGD